MSFFQSRSSWIERNQISLILPFSLRPSFYVGYLVNVIKEYDSTIGAILGHRFARAFINSEVVNSCESTLITLRKHWSCLRKTGRNFTGVVCIHKENIVSSWWWDWRQQRSKQPNTKTKQVQVLVFIFIKAIYQILWWELDVKPIGKRIVPANNKQC